MQAWDPSFEESLRAYCAAQGIDLDAMLEVAGRALPDVLPAAPRRRTQAEIDAFIAYEMSVDDTGNPNA